MNGGKTEPLVVRGVLRHLPPSPAVRIVRGMLGLAVLSALVRFLLGIARRGTLCLYDEGLELTTETKVLGQIMGRASIILRTRDLAEFTLEERGEDPRWVAGLCALGIGTLLGVLLTIGGLLAAPLSLSLIALGGAALGLGVLLDFWLDSGRPLRRLAGPPQLVVRASSSRGWVLSQVDATAARLLTDRLRQHWGLPPAETPPESSSSAH